MDEVAPWFQLRITSSLRPKADEMKAFLSSTNYSGRSCLAEFIRNEDIRKLFVYLKFAKGPIQASLIPPKALESKCMCLIKSRSALKLTAENIGQHVMLFESSKSPLKHLDVLLQQVFLPLLCAGLPVWRPLVVNADRLLDATHKFVGQLEMIRGHVKGHIVLPIPPVKVLQRTTPNANQTTVIHVLESAVIGWIKQVKVVLNYDALAELEKHGTAAGIYQEEAVWEKHIQDLHSLNAQLDSEVAREILSSLELADSMYGRSFKNVRKDIEKALFQAEENLQYLSTLLRWCEPLKLADSVSEILKYFPPLLHTLFLIWMHSSYYHQPKVFIHLVKLLSTEVISIAAGIVGGDLLREPSQSYKQLKSALKVCATFRGTYLDVKAKADEMNTKKIEEHIHHMSSIPTDALWSAKLYGPLSAKYSLRGWQFPGQEKDGKNDKWVNSPWPSHGADCFNRINFFMERCNDVLELVETIKHFQLLETVARIGGTGSDSQDAMVQEIHETYCRAMDVFTRKNGDILFTESNQSFEKAFFDFRITIKELEFQIAEVLQSDFQQTPTIGAQLRLLQVFEGISGRDLVQKHLKVKEQQLLSMLIDEVTQVKSSYQEMCRNACGRSLAPPTVNKLRCLKGLQDRISEPMHKLKDVLPHSLKGDFGWKLRHLYSDTMEELQRYEKETMDSWLQTAEMDLSQAIKKPLLVISDKKDELEDSPFSVELNLDPDFVLLLREANYFRQAPFHIHLHESVETFLKNEHVNRLWEQAARLETVLCKYNEITRNIHDYEKGLLENMLSTAQTLLQSGLSIYTWNTESSADFIEQASSLICTDLYFTFSTVRNNCLEILTLSNSWSQGRLDIFCSRSTREPASMEELLQEQGTVESALKRQIISDGQRIHQLIGQSFKAVSISEASPAWQGFTEHMDILVLQGLKRVTLSSLASMLNLLLEEQVPILQIHVDLVDGNVAFSPPLDESTAEQSVLEHVRAWLKAFLLRGALVTMISSTTQGGYHEYVAADKEIIQLVGHIMDKVQDGCSSCQATLDVLSEFSYLWKKDVNSSFRDFLNGFGRVKSTNPARFADSSFLMDFADTLSDRSFSRQSSSLRSQSTLLIEAERAFLMPSDAKPNAEVSLLEDFDAELSAHRIDQDKISKLQDWVDIGWIQVDFRPIKQILLSYSFKWMWTFARYLTDKVTDTLKSLDAFLKRTEPHIEGITGEERDTGFFMSMMRLFNEVSAKQTEMEGQFFVMQKTLKLLEKYDVKLPVEIQALFKAIPSRWNNLKTKISLAKQRLSPKIHQESERINKDLSSFAERLNQLKEEIDVSDVYMRDCLLQNAYVRIKKFTKQVKSLQQEAKDLKELQELLEATIVDFATLNECQSTVRNLTLMWQAVEVIRKQQNGWKLQPWQVIDTAQLIQSTEEQLNLIKSLSRKVQGWDVYTGTMESVNVIQEDFNKPAADLASD
ncbi:dynein beta chain, flagellar outer arm-like [Polypterus senegalus]|uniref:dynein beta chain, flagellar outer arm-like n=1 Tax=Polypterus senegalus TaxID=55291 RepID=UPI001966257C|nr:dynein beta chain, flagellar outer arm-like [Polypterus senegalus]